MWGPRNITPFTLKYTDINLNINPKIELRVNIQIHISIFYSLDSKICLIFTFAIK